MPAYEDVLAREEAWFTGDLAAQGVPALTAGLGGPFQAVAAPAG